MARRLFSPDIVGSDAFLEMPISTQALYFHLGMYADDDGFVNPKKIMRLIGVSDDDLKVLISKRFVLAFESGVVVIKHWLIHNSIRKDRYNETKYLEEKNALEIKENSAYTENKALWQPAGNQMATQVKLSKGKVSKDKEGESEQSSPTPKEKALSFFTGIEILRNRGNDAYATGFLLSLVSRTGITKEIVWREVQKFTSYWTELNSTGKKQRWQTERTFEVERRLATWLGRAGKFDVKLLPSKYKAGSVNLPKK